MLTTLLLSAILSQSTPDPCEGILAMAPELDEADVDTVAAVVTCQHRAATQALAVGEVQHGDLWTDEEVLVQAVDDDGWLSPRPHGPDWAFAWPGSPVLPPELVREMRGTAEGADLYQPATGLERLMGW